MIRRFAFRANRSLALQGAEHVPFAMFTLVLAHESASSMTETSHTRLEVSIHNLLRLPNPWYLDH